MKQIKKIILSLVLGSALLLSSVPAQAQAATQDGVDEVTVSADLFAPKLTQKFDPFDPNVVLRAGVVNIAKTSSGPFTTRSTPEIICPQMDVTLLSLVAYCEDDETDDVIFSIWGNGDDNKEFALDISFKADGHTKTYSYYIPKGEYKANFHSSTTSIKRATAVCSVEP